MLQNAEIHEPSDTSQFLVLVIEVLFRHGHQMKQLHCRFHQPLTRVVDGFRLVLVRTGAIRTIF
ncbi:hypothetical protein CH063_10865 [Colletotrichum higginsianum]|uniref:Uncharacterized protein n=1 Tax=Colletotrichum higginsianum (strain IMI 349063) TaxID=759273 RepID=H1VJ40_COLHI|nr:hypothetical protein CH063_10865 [Colletotrichum higginsianum]